MSHQAFGIGQEVRILRGAAIGSTGHVRQFDGSDETYFVSRDDGSQLWYDAEELQSVPTARLTLAPSRLGPAKVPAGNVMHDGQANTSGVEREGVPFTAAMAAATLAEIKRRRRLREADLFAPDAVEREPLGRGLASAILGAYREHTTPSTITVSEGIVRWQQADPRHRQVHVTYTGHVVVATVTLLDGSAPRLIKFVRPFSAADVIGFLDGLTAVPPHEPVTMGNIDSKETR